MKKIATFVIAASLLIVGFSVAVTSTSHNAEFVGSDPFVAQPVTL